MDTNLQGESNIKITINDEVGPRMKSNWLIFIRGWVILLLLYLNFWVVLETTLENQRSISVHIELKYDCAIQTNDYSLQKSAKGNII